MNLNTAAPPHESQESESCYLDSIKRETSVVEARKHL